MKSIQIDKTVQQIVNGVKNHRVFDDMSPLSENEQYRLDYDRAVLTTQILISVIGDIGTPELRDILISAGFHPTIVGDALRFYPEALY
jgi:hypothetical protein